MKFWKEGQQPEIEETSEDEQREATKVDAAHVSMSQEIGGSGGSSGEVKHKVAPISPEVSGIQAAELRPLKSLANLSSVEMDKSAVGLLSSMMISLEVDAENCQ